MQSGGNRRSSSVLATARPIAASLAGDMPDKTARLFSIFRRQSARERVPGAWRRPLSGSCRGRRPDRPAVGGDTPLRARALDRRARAGPKFAPFAARLALRGFRRRGNTQRQTDTFDLAVSLFSLQGINDLPGALIQIRRCSEARRPVPGRRCWAARTLHRTARGLRPGRNRRRAAASARGSRPSPMCATWAACCSARVLPCR